MKSENAGHGALMLRELFGDPDVDLYKQELSIDRH
jgi:hypothetical protein